MDIKEFKNTTTTGHVTYDEDNISSTIDISELSKDVAVEDTCHLPNMTFDVDEHKKELEKYEMVNSPRHYNTYSVEVIDMFERIYGPEKTAIWCELTGLKYRMRMGTKPENPISQDLEKEQWYLNKAKMLRDKMKGV